MAQIAFLASTVSPSVAAAAAQAAMAAVTEDAMLLRDVDVITPYGSGRYHAQASLKRRTTDQMLEVALPWGIAYLHASSVKFPKQVSSCVCTMHGHRHDLRALSMHRASCTLSLLVVSCDVTCPCDSQESASSSDTMSDIPSTSTSTAPGAHPFPHHLTSTISATCIAGACLKARELASEEERKVLRLVAQLVQAQMRRIELKVSDTCHAAAGWHARVDVLHSDAHTHACAGVIQMQYGEELHEWVEKQRRSGEMQAQQVATERLSMAQQRGANKPQGMQGHGPPQQHAHPSQHPSQSHPMQHAPVANQQSYPTPHQSSPDVNMQPAYASQSWQAPPSSSTSAPYYPQ